MCRRLILITVIIFLMYLMIKISCTDLARLKVLAKLRLKISLQHAKQGGDFKDLFDFCQRIDLRKVNKRRALEALIKSGCFDSFGKHRATLMASLE